MVTNQLCRDDIVGQSIVKVSQLETVDVYQVFCCLSNGVTFEIQLQDPMVTEPITRLSFQEDRQGEFIQFDNLDCEGCVIIEVLTSECWPSFGLLLESPTSTETFVFRVSDWGPNMKVGPVLIPAYEEIDEDVHTYWGLEPWRDHPK